MCAKVGYGSGHDAGVARDALHAGRKHLSVGVYHCQHGGQWHLGRDKYYGARRKLTQQTRRPREWWRDMT